MAIKPALLTVLTAGTIGGGATGAYFLFKPDTPVAKPIVRNLKEAMGTNGFKALDTEGDSDNEKWKKLIDKYNSESLPEGVTRITVAEAIEKSPNDEHVANIGRLKKACKALLEKTDDYENDKVTVTNWCNKQSKLISADVPEGQHN